MSFACDPASGCALVLLSPGLDYMRLRPVISGPVASASHLLAVGAASYVSDCC